MKKISCISIFLLITQNLFAQTQFHMHYGSKYQDNAEKVVQTKDGNFVIAGMTFGFGSGANAFIMKVNSSGSLLWIKDFSGINNDIIYDIIELPDKKLLMCGETDSYGAGSSDAFLMKTDSVGNIIWAKAYGDIFAEKFNKLSEDGTGGFYVSGFADDVSNSQRGSIVSRMDSSGNTLWVRWVLDDLSNGNPVMTKVSTGGVILGESVSPNDNFSLWKFSPTGNLVWSYNYLPTPSGSGLFGQLAIIENTIGEILVNTSLRNINTVAQDVDNFIIKLNSSGGLIWDKSYGGTYNDVSETISNAKDTSIIVCGYTNSAGNGSEDDFLMKLRANGVIQWAKAYGSIGVEEPSSVVETSDNGFIFTGFTISSGSSNDSVKVHLVKTDSSGNSTCNSISWNPIVKNQTINIGAASVPVNYTLQQDNSINWNLNNRHFHSADNCNSNSIVSDTFASAHWNIYPNPLTSSATLETEEKFETSTLTMFNIYGQLIIQFKITNSKTVITRDNLADGIYIYQITCDTKVIGRGKIIIE